MSKKDLEKGKCLHKAPCPECGSSDARQFYEKPSGVVDSFCHSCDTFFPSDDNVQEAASSFVKRHKSKPMFDINNVESLPTREIRGVREEICKGFGVKVLL